MNANTSDMNIILVHGALADTFSLSKVIPVLKNSGHRVYMLDRVIHTRKSKVAKMEKWICQQ